MSDMSKAWMNIFKAEIYEHDLERACQFVRDGGMTVKYAAEDLKLEPSEFIAEMEKRGYKIPENNM